MALPLQAITEFECITSHDWNSPGPVPILFLHTGHDTTNLDQLTNWSKGTTPLTIPLTPQKEETASKHP